MNWFFKSFSYIKNVFFWGILCWCSLENEQMRGALKWPFLQIEPPYHLLTFWCTPTWYTSKEHIFIVGKRFEKLIYSLLEKIEKRRFFFFTPFHIGVLCTKTLKLFRQASEWSNWKNFSIFPNIIFQKIQNLAEKVAKNQFWDLLHRN